MSRFRFWAVLNSIFFIFKKNISIAPKKNFAIHPKCLYLILGILGQFAGKRELERKSKMGGLLIWNTMWTMSILDILSVSLQVILKVFMLMMMMMTTIVAGIRKVKSNQYKQNPCNRISGSKFNHTLQISMWSTAMF